MWIDRDVKENNLGKGDDADTLVVSEDKTLVQLCYAHDDVLFERSVIEWV